MVATEQLGAGSEQLLNPRNVLHLSLEDVAPILKSCLLTCSSFHAIFTSSLHGCDDLKSQTTGRRWLVCKRFRDSISSSTDMQPYTGCSSYCCPYSGVNPTYSRCFGEYDNPSYPFLRSPLWNNCSNPASAFTNPAAFAGGSPFSLLNNPPYGDVAPQSRLWSSRDIDPSMLWSRGISSPCFRHDHHVIIRNSAPPFSAGNWEIDRRQMIEVQFDQFGVASDCRSTWGRTGPWRANRYRFSHEEAYTKLRIEITMLLSRLGVDTGGDLHQPGRDFGDPFQPWSNGNGYEYPSDDFKYVRFKKQIDSISNNKY